MAKTFFQPGTVVTSEFLNSLNNPTPGGGDFDGALPLISDDGLDPAPGNILNRFQTFEQAFQVIENATTADATGVTVRLREGRFIGVDGRRKFIGETDVFLPAGQETFVFITAQHQITTSSFYPVLCKPLHRFTVNSENPAEITNQVNELTWSRFNIIPQANLTNSFGRSGVTDITYTGSGFVSGDIVARNITLNSGVELTVGVGTRFFCSGTFTMLTGSKLIGSVTVNGAARSNVSGGTGSLLIGGFAGAGPSPGRAFVEPNNYTFQARQSSGGGSGRVVVVDGQAFLVKGGNGGGVVTIEAAGVISIGASCELNFIGAGGEPGEEAIIKGGAHSLRSAGAGGGSGGLVELRSATQINTNATSLINVRGGNGGAAFVEASPQGASGGGGGGGGYCVMEAPSINDAGSINLQGGTKGSDVGPTPLLGASSGGAWGGAGGLTTNGSNGQFIRLVRLPL